ncbi:MAG TPA: hypothetical protein VLA49_01230 [Anaerolineales bacterium]|nr:hypothetical protein [Anaerolineales bacterium]
MLVAKQVADLITTSRALLSFILAWLGFIQGESALALAAWIMVLDWTGDAVDGVIARRSREQYHTWIGDHDLEVDMLVSIGLFVYMLTAGYWGIWQAGVYLVIWLLVFWRWGLMPSLGMLFQAPIYGWFIWVALRDQFSAGLGMVIWIIAAVVLTWPRFPEMVIPRFLKGMRDVVNDRIDSEQD